MQYPESPNSQPLYPQQPVTPQPGYYPPQQVPPVGAPAPGMAAPVAPMPGYPQQPYQHPGMAPSTPKIPDRKSVASKLIEVVYLLLIILESVLALRFVFKMLGADTRNLFIQFLYSMTEVFTFPFSSLFGTSIQNRVTVQQFSLEFTTLFAMGIYALMAFIVVKIINIFR